MSKTLSVMWGQGCTETFWTVEEAKAEITYLNGLIAKRKASRTRSSLTAAREIRAWEAKAEAIEKEIRRVA